MASRRRKAEHAENVAWATEIKDRAHIKTTARGHAMTWRLENEGVGHSPTWYGECGNCGAAMSAFPGGTSAGGLGRVARDMDCTGPGTAWQGEMVAELQHERVNAAVSRFGQDVKDGADRDWLRSQGIKVDDAPPRVPPPPPPRIPQPKDERTPVMTTSLPPVFDGLDKAASELAKAAMEGGIGRKRDVLYSLSGGLEGVSRAVRMIADNLGGSGYGPEVTDSVYAASTAIFAASTASEEATHAVGALMNMTVGQLATSGRQAPNNSELNGN